MMYLQRADAVYRTGVISPFNLNQDPLETARAQLDRWTSIAQAGSVPANAPQQQATSPSGMSGLGQPMSPIVGGRAQPDIRSAGPRVTYPGVRSLPVSARMSNVMPSGVAAMNVAGRLSLLDAPTQAGLLHRLSYAFAHQGQGREAGVLRAILLRVPVRGNNIQLAASLLQQFTAGDMAFVDAAISQAGRGG